MGTRRIVETLVLLALIVGSPALVVADDPPSSPTEATPARLSYIHGEVSFWRPGAADWAEARVNTPLAPGDLIYTGQGGTVEVQFGPRAFMRAGNGTQIGLDNQEPDYVQFRVTAGHAGLDLRELAAGHTVEIATPNAAFTVERTGYYHVAVSEDSTTFRPHRGGTATVTPAGGTATPIAANQQIVVSGTDAPRVDAGPAPELTAWDRWNYQRTAYLLQPSTTQHVSSSVYGAEALAQHGNWRTVETYGRVWVPATVAPDWVPYSTGRWIWDPRFGWTWLDDAPWGWAPYHYGRWVFVGSSWAWAPGPVVVRPVYSPALVVFLGGPVTVSVGVHPLHWAPLGWGEPVIPWWGRPGVVGVASWNGWGGPRVVNNVVVNRTTNIHVTNITVYKNVHVHNAVVAVPGDRFGHGHVKPTRIDHARVRELKPVRGALDVKPVATSVMPAGGSAVKPPAVIHERKVVATRAPRDFTPTLKAQGLGTSREVTSPAAPQLVPAPRRERGRVTAATEPANAPDSAEKARRRQAPDAHPAAPPATRAVPEVAPGASRAGRGAEDKPQGAGDRARTPDEKTSHAAAPPGSRTAKDAERARRQAQQPPAPPAAGAVPEVAPGASRPGRGAEDKPQGAGDRARTHDEKTSRAASPPDLRPARNAEPARRQVQQPPAPPAHDFSTQASKPGPRAKGPGDPRGRGEREQSQPPMRDNERPDRPDHRGIR